MDGSGMPLLAHTTFDDEDDDQFYVEDTQGGKQQPNGKGVGHPHRQRRSSSLIKNGKMLRNAANGPVHQPSVPNVSNSFVSCFCSPCDAEFPLLKELVLALDHFPHLGKDDSLEVAILTYNLFIRPPGIKNNDDDFKEERLDEFIEVMDAYDIIGLQEMFSSFSGRVNKLIDAAHKKGFYYSLKSVPHGTFSSFLVDGGLLLLSKYPIIEDDGIIYSQGVQSDGLASKGVVYAKIQVSPSPDACFHLFLTHTQASYLDGDAEAAKRSTDMRNKQLMELQKFMEKKVLAGHNVAKEGEPARIQRIPALLLGDLNVNGRQKPESDEDSEEFQTMMRILSSNHYHIVDLLREHSGRQPITFGDVIMTEKGIVPRETKLTCKEDWGSRQRLDYIFHVMPNPAPGTNVSTRLDIKPSSTKVEPFYIDGKPFGQLSDHYGISTRLRYHKSASSHPPSPPLPQEHEQQEIVHHQQQHQPSSNNNQSLIDL